MEKCIKCGKLIKEPKDGVLGEKGVFEKDDHDPQIIGTAKWPVYCKECAKEIGINK